MARTIINYRECKKRNLVTVERHPEDADAVILTKKAFHPEFGEPMDDIVEVHSIAEMKAILERNTNFTADLKAVIKDIPEL